jgi:acetylornithine deacetylase
MSLLDLARTLIDIDSTTGREAEACRWLADHLRARGYAVTEQPVEGGRNNILAFVDPKPEIVLSTHVDCVPPFFPSRVGGGRLHGRGACDAKGSIAAQVTAVERLRAEGEGRVGLLFVVGEERGSDGAAAADDLAPGSRFLIDGEPTDNRLGQATRGVLRLRLRATGRAAHSSQPERGVSAIDALVDALVELRRLPLPEDPDLGSTFYTVGLISGGIAPNVVSPTAEAELNFRTVGPGADVVESLAPLRPRVSIEHIGHPASATVGASPPLRAGIDRAGPHRRGERRDHGAGGGGGRLRPPGEGAAGRGRLSPRGPGRLRPPPRLSNGPRGPSARTGGGRTRSTPCRGPRRSSRPP